MYIDESIPIPASTPDYLLDWEGVEASIKAAYLDGTISQADALQLFARYGITGCI